MYLICNENQEKSIATIILNYYNERIYVKHSYIGLHKYNTERIKKAHSN